MNTNFSNVLTGILKCAKKKKKKLNAYSDLPKKSQSFCERGGEPLKSRLHLTECCGCCNTFTTLRLISSTLLKASRTCANTGSALPFISRSSKDYLSPKRWMLTVC